MFDKFEKIGKKLDKLVDENFDEETRNKLNSDVKQSYKILKDNASKFTDAYSNKNDGIFKEDGIDYTKEKYNSTRDYINDYVNDFTRGWITISMTNRRKR